MSRVVDITLREVMVPSVMPQRDVYNALFEKKVSKEKAGFWTW